MSIQKTTETEACQPEHFRFQELQKVGARVDSLNTTAGRAFADVTHHLEEHEVRVAASIGKRVVWWDYESGIDFATRPERKRARGGR